MLVSVQQCKGSGLQNDRRVAHGALAHGQITEALLVL